MTDTTLEFTNSARMVLSAWDITVWAGVGGMWAVCVRRMPTRVHVSRERSILQALFFVPEVREAALREQVTRLPPPPTHTSSHTHTHTHTHTETYRHTPLRLG